MVQGEVPRDRQLVQFAQFQQHLIAHLETLQPYLVRFFHQLQLHLLRSTGFDLELKIHSVNFYVVLPPAFDELVVVSFAALNECLNLIGNNPRTQVLLEKQLRVVPPAQISQLFRYILNHMPSGKKTVLRALVAQAEALSFAPTFDDLIKLRVLMMDEDRDVKALSEKVYARFQSEVTEERIKDFDVVRFVQDHSQENVEKFSALSLTFLERDRSLTGVLFGKVFEAASVLYTENLSEESLTFFPGFLTLNIGFITAELISPIFTLLVTKYCSPAQQMLSQASVRCGIDVVRAHGKSLGATIVQVLEKFLKNATIRQENQISTLVFLGVASPFVTNKALLDGVARKILALFEKGGPEAQQQQKAMAKNLTELMTFFENPDQIIRREMAGLFSPSSLEERKGKAYLVAGLIRGLGVEHIEKLRIMDTLQEHTDAKKEKFLKESVLVLLEGLFDTLGRLCEPYIERIVQFIMVYISDALEEIRELAIRATKAMMQSLTGYGVKIILPFFLRGLEESGNWRGKVNNIWALGNMAFCSPKQLSSCLPQIVPKLSLALSDTHP